MGEDTERNICIFGELQSLYEKGYSTIVFACSLKHAKLLHRICTLSKMKVAKIVDTTRYQQRKKIVKDFIRKICGENFLIFGYRFFYFVSQCIVFPVFWHLISIIEPGKQIWEIPENYLSTIFILNIFSPLSP